MKILKIDINDFGCLSGRSFDFSGNLNLIVGDNESGKSTLLSFIKFMLYGMPKKSSENSVERSRSISWETGTASGSMQVEFGGKTYTVVRHGVLRVTAKRESYSEECYIVDDEKGIRVHQGECPGELFLGVPLSVYESTCFIRQLGCIDINAGDISQSLENMLISADESLSLQKALDKIDAARKLFRHKTGKGGSLWDLEAEQTALNLRLATAMDNYNKILEKTDAVNEMRANLSEKRTELDRLDDMLSALNLVGIIKRFDILHQNEAQLAQLEENAANYRRENSAPDGYLPDGDFISELENAISALSAAQRSLNAAKAVLGSEEKKLKDFSPVNSVALEEKLRRVSSAESVCDAIKTHATASLKKKKTARTMFIISAISLLAGVGLYFVNPLLCLVGAGLLAASLSLGITFASASKKRLSLADATLTEYGVSSDKGDIYERLELLKKDIQIFFENRARLSELEHNFSLAGSACRLRESDVESCRASIDKILTKWNGGATDHDTALAKAKEIHSKLHDFSVEIAHLRRTAKNMSDELMEYNEKDIRARVPASIVDKYSHKDIEDLERQKKFEAQTLKLLSEKCLSAERELITLENETENPARLSASIEENKKEYEAQSLKFEAIIMAQEALADASANIRSSVTPALRSRAGEFMSVLTADKYSAIGIDEGYNMSALSGTSTHSVSLLSAGTKDLAYISLRMALLSLLYKNEPPTLLLDDAFTQLDDQRLKRALTLLGSYCERNGQCILLSCHTREETFLKDIREANVIRL